MNSTIFHNAIILTQNRRQPLATSMLVEGNRIISVGDYEEVLKLRKTDSQLIDLEGKTILPGFNDAHIHVWKVGQLESFIIDLRGTKSICELQEKVRLEADSLPAGKWIIGRGFNEQVLEGKQMPVKEDLDAISSQHPIFLTRTCAHIAVVNSFVLQKAEINSISVAPIGGVIGKTDSGEPTGIFYETALGLITKHIPTPSQKDYEQMILLGANALLKNGITSVTDPAVHPELLKAYLNLDRKKQTLLRFNLMPILLPDGGAEPFPFPQQHDSDFLLVDTVKFFSDGGLSGKTAALKRTYKNSTSKGILRLQHNYFLSLARRAQRKGFRIGTHAIGDEAIDLVIDVYKELHSEFGDTRNRIEHFGLPSKKNVNDVAAYGFVPVSQTIFLEELGENFMAALDEEYLRFCYPVRSLLDKNIKVALSTDAPVVKNMNPWSGIKVAITRQTNKGNKISPQESITTEEAIYAYTMGGAYAEGKEKIKGSIEPEKLADFIILDRNPLQIPTEELESINVESTYIDGKCLFKRSHSIL